MEITPLIPDGYNGRIKRLTCHFCLHVFYVTLERYHASHPEYCHECSSTLDTEQRQKEMEELVAETVRQSEALIAEIEERRKGTPEAEEIKRQLEERRPGYRAIMHFERKTEKGRVWDVCLVKEPVEKKSHDVWDLVIEDTPSGTLSYYPDWRKRFLDLQTRLHILLKDAKIVE